MENCSLIAAIVAAMWQATYEPYCSSSVKKGSATSPPLYLDQHQRYSSYFNSTSILDLHKHDVPMALMEANKVDDQSSHFLENNNLKKMRTEQIRPDV